MSDPTATRLGQESEAARDLLSALGDDDDEINHDIIEGETNLLEAVEIALAEIDECELLIAGCKDRITTYQSRKGRLEARKDRVRALIEQAMLRVGLPSLKLAGATLSVKRTSPKIIITDESAIPAEFWKSEPKLDRSALAEAAKDRAIPGVEMSNGGAALQVRRK